MPWYSSSDTICGIGRITRGGDIEGDVVGWRETVRTGIISWLIGRCWIAGRVGVAGLMAWMVWTAKGSAGIGESIVFRLRKVDIRRRPLLIFVYEDLPEDTERSDEAAEVTEVVGNEGVWNRRCSSLELSDGG